jgi:hypothetical protein
MALDAQAAFSYLDNAEQALDGLQGWLDNTFASVGSYGQEGVDAVCAWAGEWVSYKIAQIESQVVKGLHGAYQGALDHMAIGGPLYNLFMSPPGASLSLGCIQEIITSILKLAFPWVDPMLDAIQVMAMVPTKIVSVAGKVASLASYRPPISQPGISFSNFNVHPKMISMGDVISGSFSVPAPPAPFTTYMKKSIASTKAKIAKEREEAGQTTSFKEVLGINKKTT